MSKKNVSIPFLDAWSANFLDMHKKYSIFQIIFRKLVVYDECTSLTIHVALDNCLVVNDVGE